MNEILKDCVITRVSNAAASGTSNVVSSVLDMQGFDSVAFIALLNSVSDGSQLSLTASENTANSTSGGSAVTGGATSTVTASSDSNHVLAVDVVRPSKRYCFVTLARGTAAATVDGIVAIQYRARSKPVSQPATLIGSAVGGPEI